MARRTKATADAALQLDLPGVPKAEKTSSNVDLSKTQATADSYQNLLTRTGTQAGNISAGGFYALDPLTRKRVDLDYMYRGSWIVGAAVDAPADDMTREGIEFGPGMEPEDIETLESAFDHLEIWQQLGDGLRWGRLYGGAIVVMMIDGQDYETPLRPETIQQGQFQGLLAIDRWQLYPAYTDLVTEPGPHYGKPKFYTVVADAGILNGAFASPLLGKRIHYSRCFRFEGNRLPFYQRMSEQGWGMSVLERIYDRLVAFDSTTQGAAQLVYKAHLRTLKVEGLNKMLAAGGKALAALRENVEQIRLFQSAEGFSLIDAKDDMQITPYAFGGLSDMMLQFAQQISGALQVPLVRLLGQSPAGMNATGDSDWRNYDDGVKKDQKSRLTHPVTRVLDVLIPSELGRAADDQTTWKFKPLRRPSENEKADIAEKTSRVILGAVDSTVIGKGTALRELRNQSRTTGVFGSITDKDIDEADREPPLPPGEGDLPQIPDPENPDGPDLGHAERAAGSEDER